MKNVVTFTLICFYIFLQFIGTSLFAQEAPEVTNVQCRQLPYPSTQVEITYDVEADCEALYIHMLLSDDSGETWNIHTRAVEGDMPALRGALPQERFRGVPPVRPG